MKFFSFQISFMSMSHSTFPGNKWWTEKTVAVVTGANKGIGFFIAEKLAKEGITTILTARQPSLGEAACEKLKKEGWKNVHFHHLDITDQKSIDSIARWLEESFGGMDILVNNAGIAYKGNVFGAKEAKTTIDTNFLATKAMCERFLPLLRNSPHGSRIVNVSSSVGKLRLVSPELQARFTDPNLTVEGLTNLVQEFPRAIAEANYRSKGWPDSMYGISKLALTIYTAILARNLQNLPDGKKVYVNACCPGYCATDMSSWKGPKSAEEGADTPVFLALSPPTSGGFFLERKPEPL